MSYYKIQRMKIFPQLKNEIKVLTICDHPCIIHLHAVFCDEDNIYLLMELANGNCLYDYLQKR
jgi:serine/threonine protein kinase